MVSSSRTSGWNGEREEERWRGMEKVREVISNSMGLYNYCMRGNRIVSSRVCLGGLPGPLVPGFLGELVTCCGG